MDSDNNGNTSKHKILFSRTNTINSIISNEVENFNNVNPELAFKRQPTINSVFASDGELTRKASNITSMTASSGMATDDTHYDRQNTYNSEKIQSNKNEDTLAHYFGQRKNYYLFCWGMGLSSGPSLCVFMYAPSLLGTLAGGIGNGCFCLIYALISLFFAKRIVARNGCKAILIFATMGNVLYVTSFMFINAFDFYPLSAYPVFAVIGGFVQALMFAAQVSSLSVTSI